MENLRLKSREAALDPPGISVLKAPTPGDAARQIRGAFPEASALREAAHVVGSASVEAIRAAGFDVIPNPTKRLPNHHRILHPDGVAGFRDEDLGRLSDAFVHTTGEES